MRITGREISKMTDETRRHKDMRDLFGNVDMADVSVKK